MENSSNNFAENFAEDAFLSARDTGIDLPTSNFSDPDDEEEEEGGGEEEAQEDNPPLDEEIVHSPVPTQSGGRPETAGS